MPPSKPDVPPDEDASSSEQGSSEVGGSAAADQAHCKQRALGLLARREHSRLELERKLAARGFEEAVIAAALDDLEGSGALAADRFAESFIRSRVAKGQGPRRIRLELAERGVAEGEAARLLKESDIDWVAEARAVRRKRFGADPPQDLKDRARQTRFLEYRGFDGSQVRAAFIDNDD